MVSSKQARTVMLPLNRNTVHCESGVSVNLELRINDIVTWISAFIKLVSVFVSIFVSLWLGAWVSEIRAAYEWETLLYCRCSRCASAPRNSRIRFSYQLVLVVLTRGEKTLSHTVWTQYLVGLADYSVNWCTAAKAARHQLDLLSDVQCWECQS